MDVEQKFEESKYIEWTTPLPLDRPMHSPKFSYMNYECYLDLFSYNMTGMRGTKTTMVVLDMVTNKPHYSFYPFFIWVNVCIVTKSEERVESWRTILSTCEIWRRPLPEIEMYLNNSMLTLGITIKYPYKGNILFKFLYYSIHYIKYTHYYFYKFNKSPAIY